MEVWEIARIEARETKRIAKKEKSGKKKECKKDWLGFAKTDLWYFLIMIFIPFMFILTYIKIIFLVFNAKLFIWQAKTGGREPEL